MASPTAYEPAAYSSSETAVLLLDYHIAFTSGLQPESKVKQFIAAAKSLAEFARANNILVVHCLIDFSRGPTATSKLNSRWAPYQNMLVQNPDSFKEIPELVGEGPNEITVIRQAGRVSALNTEGLREVLQDRGIKSLVVTGLVTGGCTLSTARDSTDAGFVTTVVEDGCWDRDEKVHDIMINQVLPMTCYVSSAEQWIASMKN